MVSDAPAPYAGERFGGPQVIRPRLGQGTFRVGVAQAYRGACAITGEHSLPVLEAAHIRPYGSEGLHDVQNGLLLRADVHRLFDRGYVTVTPEHRFEVSRRLREEWENGKGDRGRALVVALRRGERWVRGGANQGLLACLGCLAVKGGAGFQLRAGLFGS